MCILYKQQMQQYSYDKSSQSYRKAKRDFDKNCSNPPVEKKPQEIVKEPAKVDIIEDEPVDTDLEPLTDTVNPLDSKEHNTQPETEQADGSTELVAEAKEQNTQAVAADEKLQEVAVEEQQVVTDIEPSTAVKQITPPVKPVINPSITAAEQPTSLMTPLLIIILVLLIAGWVLYKLRMKKQSREQSSKLIQSKPDVPPVAKKSVNEINDAAIKPAPPQTDMQQSEHLSVNSDSDAADSKLSDETLAVDTTDPVKPLLSTEHDFKEPEIRTFDPNAPLPGVKASVESHTKAEDSEQHLESELNQSAADEPEQAPSPTADNDIVNRTQDLDISTKPDTDPAMLQNDETLTTAPSVPIPDETPLSSADTPDDEDEIAQALAALNNEIDAEQHKGEANVTDESNPPAQEQGDRANPFANLSLDPTWDPNNDEKPKIEAKKKAPKSAQLIAAEERAKQLKTDD